MSSHRADQSLATQAARGAMVTLVAQIARIAIQAVSVIVLARLLSPSDFGLLAIVMAVIGFGELFRDFGLSQATVQAATLSVGQRSNMFWINTVIGLALSLILILAAHPIALFVGDERVQNVAVALAPVFLLNGIATQYRADLSRDLRFGALAFSEVAPAAVALTVAVMAASQGWGYWSLVINQLGVAALTTVLLPLICRWLPKWFNFRVPIRSLLNYGGNLLGVQILVYVSRNVDRVIIAGTLGIAQLGIYDRAYQLLMLPLNQINAPANRIALPVLSRLNQDMRYNSYLLRGQTVLLHALSAVFGITAALSGVLLPYVLGSQWGATVPIFQAFALAGFAQAAGYVTYWVFLSKALTRSNFWYTLSTRPIIIAAVIIGSMWGAQGIAWGYSIIMFVMWPLGIWWVRRLTPIPARALILTGLRCLLTYLLAGASAWSVVSSTSGLHPLVSMTLGTLAFFAALCLLLCLSRSLRRDYKDLGSILTILKERKG